MSASYGWQPTPEPKDGVVYAGGVFRTDVLHRIPFRTPVFRLDSQIAADLGWLNRYVVFAVCGRLCWAIRADVAVDRREHCPECWRAQVDAEPVETGLRTSRGGSVHGDLWQTAQAPEAVLQPAAALTGRPRLLTSSLPLGHRPIRRRPHRAEADTACITANHPRTATHPPAAAEDHHAA